MSLSGPQLCKQKFTLPGFTWGTSEWHPPISEPSVAQKGAWRCFQRDPQQVPLTSIQEAIPDLEPSTSWGVTPSRRGPVSEEEINQAGSQTADPLEGLAEGSGEHVAVTGWKASCSYRNWPLGCPGASTSGFSGHNSIFGLSHACRLDYIPYFQNDFSVFSPYTCGCTVHCRPCEKRDSFKVENAMFP